MQPQVHRSDARILGRRTLERDHRVLSNMLRPGMAVLDVGCGTGAITTGIAQAVGPQGMIVGVDRNAGLLPAPGRQVRTVQADATTLPFTAAFDIVTAARTLQWIPAPGRAIASMASAICPGGLVVILDYNHAANAWEPDPPPAFQRFYRAFLDWRDANGWDNHMATHLPGLFSTAGLTEIEEIDQDEITTRGDPDFADRAAIWTQVIESLGSQVCAGNFISGSELLDAHDEYASWVETELQRQTLRLRTVIGRRPA